MKPDRCSFCNGGLIEGKTDFVAKMGYGVLSISDVLEYVCEVCDKAYYAPEVSEKIDKIMEKFHESALFVHPVAAGQLNLNEAIARLLRLWGALISDTSITILR